jgi:hypothetical protein
MKTRQIVAVFLIILCCLSWSVSSIAVSYDPIVEQVQKRLTELGYDPGPVDGKMGRKTTAAIREFQQDRSLLATGELNEATILKLGLSLQTEKPDTEKISKKDQEPTLTNVIDTFEREILSYIQNNEIRKAFIATAEYEHELISKYDPPTFQNDLFQSEADHLSFHSFFTSWKQAELEELEIPMFNILFALEGEVEEDRFILLSMGIGQIQQRMGISESYKTGLSDRELLFGATMIASELGSIRNQEFKSIGEHQVLVLEIETPMGGPSVMMVSLGHGKQLYAFILSSSLRNRAENRKHLVELIKTVKFNYKPADESKIKAIREKFLGQDEPEPILQSVAQLALSGEYNATTEELARLRTLLSKLMPKPFIKENVAYYPAYGITLANPDEEKWKLSFEESGIIKAILLEDKWSTKQEGIGIFILDLILSYGPQATKIVGDKEEERKQALINLGRGSALYGGGPIESERLTTIKNNLAYEAIVATNMPGLKAKCFSTFCLFFLRESPFKPLYGRVLGASSCIQAQS